MGARALLTSPLRAAAAALLALGCAHEPAPDLGPVRARRVVELSAPAESVVMNGTRRRAVPLEPGRTLRATVAVPTAEAGGTLELWLGARPLHGARGTVHVRVEVFAQRPDGDRVLLASGEAEGGPPHYANPWRELTVELPEALRGAPLDLAIECSGDARRELGGEAYLALPVLRSPVPPEPELRDVVLVTLDTLRADQLTPWGREGAHTPCLDALAREGTVFLDAHATANSTLPSHATLMTSLPPRDHDVLANDQRLPSQARTLAEVLAEAGYETLSVVSVRHLAEFSGFDQGFDVCSGPARDQCDGRVTVAELKRVLPDRPGPPLFLWLHLFDPHTDDEGRDPYLYNPPARYARLFAGSDGPRGDRDAELARYRGEISKTDVLLRRALDVLDARGFDRERLLVVVGDHGEGFGELGVSFAHQGLHASVTHVPLLLCGPGVPRGVVRDELVSTIDLPNTVLELCGLEGRALGIGASLVPLLRGEGGGRDAVMFEEDHGRSVGVRTRDWHFVRTLREFQGPRGPVPAGRELLLRADSDAEQDLSAEHPEVVAALRRLVDEHLAGGGAAWESPPIPHTTETRAELEGLGYTPSDD